MTDSGTFTDAVLSSERLQFLATLPTVINSSLELRQIIELAIDHLKSKLEAEAASVFLLTESEKELVFWALKGGAASALSGKKIPANQGIVGWTIQHQKPALVKDASKDPRFTGEAASGSGFETLSLICVPLTTHGHKKIGAVEVINKVNREIFSASDLLFLQQFAHQLALAIDNASLFKKLKEQNAKLKEFSQRKNQVIDIIAHEFNTPLGIIQNSAELLASGSMDSESTAQLAATLKDGVSRLSRLVKEIKNVYLSTSSDLQLSLKEIKVENLFKQIISLLGSDAIKRNITLSVDVPESLPAAVGDFTFLLVALRNLTANAIRFTPDGGSVILSASHQSGMVEVSVSDTGIGIPPEKLPLIFETFYEGTDSLHHSSGEFAFRSSGLGIGLATVKAIVEAHGSSVDVKSEVNKGTVFSFILKTGQYQANHRRK